MSLQLIEKILSSSFSTSPYFASLVEKTGGEPNLLVRRGTGVVGSTRVDFRAFEKHGFQVQPFFLSDKLVFLRKKKTVGLLKLLPWREEEVTFKEEVIRLEKFRDGVLVLTKENPVPRRRDMSQLKQKEEKGRVTVTFLNSERRKEGKVKLPEDTYTVCAAGSQLVILTTTNLEFWSSEGTFPNYQVTKVVPTPFVPSTGLVMSCYEDEKGVTNLVFIRAKKFTLYNGKEFKELTSGLETITDAYQTSPGNYSLIQHEWDYHGGFHTPTNVTLSGDLVRYNDEFFLVIGNSKFEWDSESLKSIELEVSDVTNQVAVAGTPSLLSERKALRCILLERIKSLPKDLLDLVVGFAIK